MSAGSATAGGVTAGRSKLVRSSSYLMLTTVASGCFGFLFWIVCARIYSPEEIGNATSLLAASSVIAYCSQFGLNTAIARYLPTAPAPGRLVSTGLVVVLSAGILVSTCYVVGLPVIAPRLGFVRDNLWYALGYVVLTTALAVNLFTDAVFVALRSAHLNLIVDGLAQNVVKLGLPIALLGIGAFGVFAAPGLAAAFAAVLSLGIIVRHFHLRLRPRVDLPALRQAVAFAGANYVASLLDLLPMLVLPILVLNELGSAAAGYYYVSFQMANLLYSGAYAIAPVLLVEGSTSGADVAALRRRSAAFLGVLMVPAAAAMAGLSGPVLRIFGGGYQDQSRGALVVLALAALTVALNSWATALLRIEGKLWSILVSNVIFAGGACGLTALWASHGIVWVAFAWLAGSGAAGLYGTAAIFLLRARPGTGDLPATPSATTAATGSGPALEPVPALGAAPALEVAPAPVPIPAPAPAAVLSGPAPAGAAGRWRPVPIGEER